MRYNSLKIWVNVMSKPRISWMTHFQTWSCVDKDGYTGIARNIQESYYDYMLNKAALKKLSISPVKLFPILKEGI